MLARAELADAKALKCAEEAEKLDLRIRESRLMDLETKIDDEIKNIKRRC